MSADMSCCRAALWMARKTVRLSQDVQAVSLAGGGGACQDRPAVTV